MLRATSAPVSLPLPVCLRLVSRTRAGNTCRMEISTVCLVLLWLSCFGASTTEIHAASAVPAAGTAGLRRLQQSGQATCPSGCDTTPGACIIDSTSGMFRCTRCLNKRVPRSDGSCGCNPGMYLANDPPTCTDCEVGFYCPGGRAAASIRYSCDWAANATTEGLTTKSVRANSRAGCVNKPGYRYIPSTVGQPTAALCPANTFSQGLARQARCNPCPAGLKTDPAGDAVRSSAAVCRVPPGWFYGATAAARCPRGEYRSGYVTVTEGYSCMRCPNGTTTRYSSSNGIAHCSGEARCSLPSCQQGLLCASAHQEQTQCAEHTIAQHLCDELHYMHHTIAKQPSAAVPWSGWVQDHFINRLHSSRLLVAQSFDNFICIRLQQQPIP